MLLNPWSVVPRSWYLSSLPLDFFSPCHHCLMKHQKGVIWEPEGNFVFTSLTQTPGRQQISLCSRSGLHIGPSVPFKTHFPITRTHFSFFTEGVLMQGVVCLSVTDTSKLCDSVFCFTFGWFRSLCSISSSGNEKHLAQLLLVTELNYHTCSKYR